MTRLLPPFSQDYLKILCPQTPECGDRRSHDGRDLRLKLRFLRNYPHSFSHEVVVFELSSLVSNARVCQVTLVLSVKHVFSVISNVSVRFPSRWLKCASGRAWEAAQLDGVIQTSGSSLPDIDSLPHPLSNSPYHSFPIVLVYMFCDRSLRGCVWWSRIILPLGDVTLVKILSLTTAKLLKYSTQSCLPF